jgi:hypothetical protein
MANEDEILRKNIINFNSLFRYFTDFLLQIIQYHYLNRNKQQEKEDKDQWTNSKSASMLLYHISLMESSNTVEFVLIFFQNYFSNEDLYIKDSIIMSFGSILDTKQTQKIKEFVVQIFPYLLELFEPKQKAIFLKCTSAWAISKICQKHIDCLMFLFNKDNVMRNNFIEILHKNLNSLKRLAKFSLEALIQISEKSQKFSEEQSPEKIHKTSILSPYYNLFFGSLLNLGINNNNNLNEYNFSANSFFALSQLIEFCPLDTVDLVNEFFPQLINALNWVNSSSNNSDKNSNSNFHINNSEVKYSNQENIISLILIYITKNNLNFMEDQYLYLFEICNQSFMERGTTFIPGIILLGNLLKIGNESGLNRLIENNDKIIKWIFLGLSNWEDVDICKQSIDTLGDLIENIPDIIYPNMESIFNKVFELGSVKLKLLKRFNFYLLIFAYFYLLFFVNLALL